MVTLCMLVACECSDCSALSIVEWLVRSRICALESKQHRQLVWSYLVHIPFLMYLMHFIPGDFSLLVS